MSQIPGALPVLLLEEAVVLPSVAAPLTIGRPSSRAALEAAAATPGKVLLVVAYPHGAASPFPTELSIGTRCSFKGLTHRESGLLEATMQGIERVSVDPPRLVDGVLRASWSPLPVLVTQGPELEALRRELLERASKLVTLARIDGGVEIMHLLSRDEDIVRATYRQAALFGVNLEKAQELLQAPTATAALRLLLGHVTSELEVAVIRNEIAERTNVQLSKVQREAVLRQQLRAIHEELGGAEPEAAAHQSVRDRLSAAPLPGVVRKEAERELDRLERTPASSPEHGQILSYLEFLLDLPWAARSAEALDLVRARAVMDEDHMGLEEVKQRIIEHLATLKLNPAAKAPVLCFVGPPGVGKTSLGRSVARALGRVFARLSLGGVHDESEVRGHRRTYVGAMPGRILQAIRRGGVNDPVVMLDEIDKLGHDHRGDPAAALLEVLDPEQNATFRDNYLDLPFDLSSAFFITTANDVSTIPAPLLDRMEVLHLSGYSEEQKVVIARTYLLPRQLERAGLPAGACGLPDETLSSLARSYSREAGVRQLEQSIGRLVRKIAVRFASDICEPVIVRPAELGAMLGPEPYFSERRRERLPPGVATGLAWTQAGGEILYVECTLLPAERGLILTGQLGEVMQESARTAQSYLQAHAPELGLHAAHFRRYGVHVHLPAGAIPKDGPSAGIALIAALSSLYSGRPARPDTAMTGEITLSGLVLPVGGLKAKVLAARRAGIARVVVPRRNELDLAELPPEVRNALEFILVERVEEALAAAGVTPRAARRQAKARTDRPAHAPRPSRAPAAPTARPD